jgi:two-component system cell cycle sensor histidine kinase/response regulator CckA
MISGIAHELNNVFQSIFLFSGLVQDSLTKHSDADVNMSQILRDTERARDLIKQILHFSRKEEIRFGAYHLQDIVQDAIRFLHASLPVEIKLETQLEMNVPPVKCDRTQIHQIIINLCNNAHHAMPEGGGTITIKLTAEKLVKDSQSKPVPMVKLEISDTGHGMDQETLDRIFDPFFTTKELGKGTGLGLSVVYSIVENIGGTISATSIVGRGSTFTMLLPADIGQISELDKTKTQFMPMAINPGQFSWSMTKHPSLKLWPKCCVLKAL